MPNSIAYWITTVLAVVLFAVPGAALVAGVPHFADEMALLGYPAYFSGLLGISKLGAALVIVLPGIPRLKEWAYAGMMFDVAGAIASRLVVEGDASTIVIPVVVGLLTGASWLLRPAGRKLSVPPALRPTG